MQHDPNESPYDGTSDIKAIGFLPRRVCATPDLNRPGSSKFGTVWVWFYGSYGSVWAWKSRVTRFRYDLLGI